MAYVITEPCIGVKDTGCIDVCPMDCIHGMEADPMLYIDPEECIDCGGCVPACPAMFRKSGNATRKATRNILTARNENA